jgi:hypothetical protein
MICNQADAESVTPGGVCSALPMRRQRKGAVRMPYHDVTVAVDPTESRSKTPRDFTQERPGMLRGSIARVPWAVSLCVYWRIENQSKHIAIQ